MNAKSKIHQMKLSKWMAIFQEQKQSNLSIKDWCSQNNISRHAFYYWRKIATESYMDSVMPDIVPIAMSHPVSEHELSNSRELYNLPDTNSHAVTISTGDIHIEIGDSATDDIVYAILKAVRHA